MTKCNGIEVHLNFEMDLDEFVPFLLLGQRRKRQCFRKTTFEGGFSYLMGYENCDLFYNVFWPMIV